MHSHRHRSWTLWRVEAASDDAICQQARTLADRGTQQHHLGWVCIQWVPPLLLQVAPLNRRAAAVACLTCQRTRLGVPQSSCLGTTARLPNRGMARFKVAMAGSMQAVAGSATEGHSKGTAQMPAPATHREPLPSTLERQNLRFP